MFGSAIALAVAYLGMIFTTDFAEFKLGIPIWDQAQRTASCYDWFEKYLRQDYDKTKIDYSEGIFNDNPALTLEQATNSKYEYIFAKLGLKAGMKLLDAGCGTGVWMDFCRQRGIEVVGLTLSPEQAKEVRKKGLTVHVMDYRKLHEPFLGEFDRITALGSSEHVCSSVGVLKNDDSTAKRCNQVRIDTWKLFYEYLKPEGKTYITVLTTNDEAEWSTMDWIQAYVLERHYGGYYSKMKDIVTNVIPETGFRVSDVQDKTRDYHWSSVVNKDHFGYWTINWNEDRWGKVGYLVQGAVTDPHLLHRWLYYYLDTWMWQFGGYQETPLTDVQVERAPVRLKYFMLEKA